MTVISLVVMEPGSQWPGVVGDPANLVAFSQRGEKLLETTRERLDALRRKQQDVQVAVLACNAQADPETGDCRARVARALLGAVARARSGRLLLTASDQTPLHARQELLSLTGALSAELQGTTATVSLRFT